MFFAPNCALCDMARSLLKVDLDDAESLPEDGPSSLESLVQDQLGDEARFRGWHFRAFLSIGTTTLLENHNYRPTFFLATARGRTTSPLEYREFHKSTLRGFVSVQDSRLPENGIRTVPFPCVEVNQHEADFCLMRKWLEQKCQSQVPITSNFQCRVIDCEDQVVCNMTLR